METVKINNTELSFNKIYYVDGVNGNDTTGDGSEVSPFKTIPNTFSKITEDNAGVCIIKEGTYIINSLYTIINPNLQITYFVKPGLEGTVTIELSTATYNGIIMNKPTRFINCIITRGTGGDARTYEYFSDASTLNLEFHNCVFDKGKISPTGFPIFTGGSGGCTITKMLYKNCVFIPQFEYNTASIGYLKGDFINCVFADSTFNTNNSTSKTNVTIAEKNYKIISPEWKYLGSDINPDNTKAHIGVYGGIFAWKWNEIYYLLKSNNQLYTYKNNEMKKVVDDSKEAFKQNSIIYLNELTNLTNKMISSMELSNTSDTGKIYKKTVKSADFIKLREI